MTDYVFPAVGDWHKETMANRGLTKRELAAIIIMATMPGVGTEIKPKQAAENAIEYAEILLELLS